MEKQLWLLSTSFVQLCGVLEMILQTLQGPAQQAQLTVLQKQS